MSLFYYLLNLCKDNCCCLERKNKKSSEKQSVSPLSFDDSDTVEPVDLRYTIFEVDSCASFQSLP